MFIKRCLFLGLLYPWYAFGMTTEVTGSLDFGNLTQLTPSASGVLSYSGNLSSLNGLVVNGEAQTVSASITFTPQTSGPGENLYLNSTEEFSLTGPTCTLRFRNPTFSQTQYTKFKTPVTATMGATLAIDGSYCTEGEYTGKWTVHYDACSQSNKCDQTRYNPPLSFSVDVKVYLATPLSIENKQDMNFGTIWVPETASTITVSPSGGYSFTGNLHFTETDITPGQFEVTGVAGRSVQVGLPASATLSTSDGRYSMLVDSFTSTPSGTLNLVGSDPAGASGTGTINVGGTLHLKSRQEAGDYTGTYSVIVSY